MSFVVIDKPLTSSKRIANTITIPVIQVDQKNGEAKSQAGDKTWSQNVHNFIHNFGLSHSSNKISYSSSGLISNETLYGLLLTVLTDLLIISETLPTGCHCTFVPSLPCEKSFDQRLR